MAQHTNSGNNKENVYSTTSSKTGIAKFFETFLRRFRTVSYLIALIPLYILGIMIMSISLTPGVYFFQYVLEYSKDWMPFFQIVAIAFSLVAGFFMYGFTIIFVAPFFNFILPLRIKPWRGGYYSLQSVPWYFHNAFTYLVRYTFLEFITPTPLNILFYRLMGMKIGKGVHLNTTNISDPSLIEIEDNVTIGGSATIVCHYAVRGYLVIAPVKIGKGATVGLKATIFGDVEIGAGATIAPHEVVLPKSRIPAGYPSKKITKRAKFTSKKVSSTSED
ncbi:MAG: hypothetical protein AB7W47_11225 [Calditrichaceae bacterium]